jgi:hypothetical protein
MLSQFDSDKVVRLGLVKKTGSNSGLFLFTRQS